MADDPVRDEFEGEMMVARLAEAVRYQGQIGLDGTLFGLIFQHADGTETQVAMAHHALPEL